MTSIDDSEVKDFLLDKGSAVKSIAFSKTYNKITSDLFKKNLELKYVAFHPESQLTAVEDFAFMLTKVEVINFPASVKHFGKVLFMSDDYIRYVSHFNNYETCTGNAFDGYGNPTVDEY